MSRRPSLSFISSTPYQSRSPPQPFDSPVPFTISSTPAAAMALDKTTAEVTPSQSYPTEISLSAATIAIADDSGESLGIRSRRPRDIIGFIGQNDVVEGGEVPETSATWRDKSVGSSFVYPSTHTLPPQILPHDHHHQAPPSSSSSHSLSPNTSTSANTSDSCTDPPPNILDRSSFGQPELALAVANNSRVSSLSLSGRSGGQDAIGGHRRRESRYNVSLPRPSASSVYSSASRSRAGSTSDSTHLSQLVASTPHESPIKSSQNGLERGSFVKEIPSPQLDPISEFDGDYSNSKLSLNTPAKRVTITRGVSSPLDLSVGSARLRAHVNRSSSFSAGSFLATPAEKGSDVNDSLYESPSLVHMLPCGSPIRFGAQPQGPNEIHALALSETASSSPTSSQTHPFPAPPSKRIEIRRPSAFDFAMQICSPVRKQEAKIGDILWHPSANEQDDVSNADILPPEVEQLGPPSPFSSAFEKQATSSSVMPASNQSLKGNALHEHHAPSQSPSPHAQPGSGAVQRIPTMVGPNSLPYARCPSGIDSFAFDRNSARPYDAIMPLTAVNRLPKSTSFDDKLLTRATSPSKLSLRAQDNVYGGNHRYREEPESPYVQESEVNTNGPAIFQLVNSHVGGKSTHNERARMRMERTRAATLKREQLRMEEQSRKEVARLLKSLAIEEDFRRKVAAEENRTAGYVVGSQPLTSIAHDVDTTHIASKLRIAAAPFQPRTASISSMASLNEYKQGTDTNRVTNLQLPCGNDQRQTHKEEDGRSNNLFAAHSAAVAPDMQALRDLLADQNLGNANDIDSLLQQQQVLLSLLRNTNASAPPPGLPSPNPINLQGANPRFNMLMAINTMMRTNQQLIEVLQDTERLLLNQRVIEGNEWPAFPGINGLADLQLSSPPFPYRLPLNSYNGWPEFMPATTLAAGNYRFPPSATPVFNQLSQAEDGAPVNQDGPPRLNSSVSMDPAVITSQRRKSVSFDEDNIAGKAVSPSDIAVAPAPAPVRHVQTRITHPLPAKPGAIDISQKLMGVVLSSEEVPKRSRPGGTGKGWRKKGPRPANDLADSTSTITISEANARRSDRSAAPSPEFRLDSPKKVRVSTMPSPKVLKSAKNAANTFMSKSANTRRPMSELSVNSNNLSMDTTRSSDKGKAPSNGKTSSPASSAARLRGRRNKGNNAFKGEPHAEEKSVEKSVTSPDQSAPRNRQKQRPTGIVAPPLR